MGCVFCCRGGEESVLIDCADGALFLKHIIADARYLAEDADTQYEEMEWFARWNLPHEIAESWLGARELVIHSEELAEVVSAESIRLLQGISENFERVYEDSDCETIMSLGGMRDHPFWAEQRMLAKRFLDSIPDIDSFDELGNDEGSDQQRRQNDSGDGHGIHSVVLHQIHPRVHMFCLRRGRLKSFERCGKGMTESYVLALNAAREEAGKELLAARNRGSEWTADALESVVIPEIDGLLSYADKKQFYFRYGRRHRTIDSMRLLLESSEVLGNTPLGKRISELQEIIDRL